MFYEMSGKKLESEKSYFNLLQCGKNFFQKCKKKVIIIINKKNNKNKKNFFSQNKKKYHGIFLFNCLSKPKNIAWPGSL